MDIIDEDILDYPHSVFAVDERPLCVWDDELEKHNLEFCEALNPDWFIDSIAPHLEGVDLDTINDLDQPSALAIRLAYHHALETFFALLFAAVQAPFCIPAWLDLYDISDLISISRRVNYRGRILNGWGIPRPAWEDLSRLFNSTWAEKEGGEETIRGFAKSWGRLSWELSDKHNRAENNSIKHGFRARPGGFVLRVGLEETPGVPAPPEAMKTIGASKHGSSVFELVPIPETTKWRKASHFHMRRQSTNWIVESTFRKLQILTTSMGNVLGTVRIRSGATPETVMFHRFADPMDFDKPWQKSPGVLSSGFHTAGPGDVVAEISADVLRARLEEASGFDADKDAT